MILTLANVLYVLVAVAMIALILFQRGSGASAGAGFGAGASATVFGARGASNFLSKSTAILAVVFFLISLGMAMYASRMNERSATPAQDLGVMEGLAVPAPAAAPVDPGVPSAPPAASEVPAPAAAPAADAAPTDAAPAGASPEAAAAGEGSGDAADAAPAETGDSDNGNNGN